MRREEGCGWMECSSPRRILARWLPGSRNVGGRTVVAAKKRREIKEHTGKDDVTAIKCMGKDLNGCGPLDCGSSSKVSELRGRDASLGNIGAGYFLLCLVAASKIEVDKMAEVRKQMEMLLEHAKEELRRKELPVKPIVPNNVHAYSTAGGCERLELDNLRSSPHVVSESLGLEASSTSLVSVSNEPRQCRRGVNQVEFQLEAELERLQINVDANKKHPKHQKNEKPEAVVGDAASARNRISSCGEATDELIYPREVISDVKYAVCPHELERKLHELLEARQQEEIREAESSLRRIQRRLHEKETELSWWREAACLLSRRVPESSRTSLERRVQKEYGF